MATISPERYAAMQRKIADAAERELRAFLAYYPEATADEVQAEVLRITRKYGAAASENALSFYNNLRDAVDGIVEWEPEPYEGFNEEYLGKWFADAYDDADGFGLRGMADLLNTAVQQAGRDTIIRNSRRDPSGARWARMPIGRTCAWCLMLASRGAVYFTKQIAEKGYTGNRYHGRCDCQPVPVFRGQKPPYDADKLYQMYVDARKSTGDSIIGFTPDGRALWKFNLTDADVAAAMRTHWSDLVADGIRIPTTPDFGFGFAPSGKAWAAPVDRSKVRQLGQHEIDTAERLRYHGMATVFEQPDGDGRSADAFVTTENGSARAEFKAPDGAGKSTISDALREARKQSPWIVLDLNRTPLDLDEVMRQIDYATKRYEGFERITVLTKDNRRIEWSA